MNGSAFGDIPIPLPPLDEQRRIVAFIEDKTRAMDNYIAGKERVLELLRELQAATVARFVTRGLDDNAPRKDSGVAWLGEIPAHWNVKRLKYVANFISRGNSPTYAEASETKVINQACVFPDGLRFEKVKFEERTDVENWKGFLRFGDILVNSTGTGTLGRVGIFQKSDEVFIADGHVTVVRDSKNRFVPHYIFYLLSTRQDWITAEAAEGATNQIELSRDKFGALQIPIPPLSEQAAIVSRLEAELSQIAVARVQLGREIELAREWRQSLIAEAVTGQLRV